eukprot:1957944-Ditylum_brightwellii.AAC.1
MVGKEGTDGKLSSKKLSISKKATSGKSDSSEDKDKDAVETSSVDSGLCNIDYDNMDVKVKEVISNFRMLAESMKKKKSTKDKCHSANLHNLKRQEKRKLGYGNKEGKEKENEEDSDDAEDL